MKNVRVLLAAGVTVAAAVTVSLTHHVASSPSSPRSFDASTVSALTCPGVSQHLGDDLTTLRVANVARASRTVVGSLDATMTTTRRHLRAAHSVTSALPATAAMTTYRADVYGGGVSGALYGGGQLSPCSHSGETEWWVAGVSTLAHQTATLVLANPAATPAVVSVTAFTSAGVLTPGADQGLTIAGGRSVAINISSQIIGEANAALNVHVASGRIVARLIEGTPGGSLRGILLGGALHRDLVWGNVPTSGIATINGFNPSDHIVSVSATVLMADFQIAPVTMTAYPHSAFSLRIIPSTGVPSVGIAAIELRASGPVAATLRDGASTTSLVASSGTALSSGLHLILNAAGQASGVVQIVGGGSVTTRGYDGAQLRVNGSASYYRVRTMTGTGFATIASSSPIAVFYATGAATAEVALDGR